MRKSALPKGIPATISRTKTIKRRAEMDNDVIHNALGIILVPTLLYRVTASKT